MLGPYSDGIALFKIALEIRSDSIKSVLCTSENRLKGIEI